MTSSSADGRTPAWPPLWLALLVGAAAAPMLCAAVVWLDGGPHGLPYWFTRGVITLVLVIAGAAGFALLRRGWAGPLEHDPSDPVPPTPIEPGLFSGVDYACPACGHNLRDLTGDRCPECGLGLSEEVLIRGDRCVLPVPQIDPGTWDPPRPHGRPWARAAAGLLLGTFLIAGLGLAVSPWPGSTVWTQHWGGGLPAALIALASCAAAAWWALPWKGGWRWVRPAAVCGLGVAGAIMIWVSLVWR